MLATLRPSIRISPSAASRMRNRQRVMDDLPAPVRPTIPTCMARGEGVVGEAGRPHGASLEPPRLYPTQTQAHTQACPPHTYLLTTVHVHIQLLQHQVQARPVPHRVIPELYLPVRGPAFGRPAALYHPRGLEGEARGFSARSPLTWGSPSSLSLDSPHSYSQISSACPTPACSVPHVPGVGRLSACPSSPFRHCYPLAVTGAMSHGDLPPMPPRGLHSTHKGTVNK